MINKTVQRGELLAARRAITQKQRQEWDQQIAGQVLVWCRTHPVKCIGIYSPIQSEPDLRAIFPEIATLGIQLALPTAPIRNQSLVFLAWEPGQALMKDRYGVLIPTETATVVQPDVLFIPCVGYNLRGFRLGYGGGFYDRTLATIPRPQAIGIAYRIGLCDLQEFDYDIPMNSIITNY